MMNNYQMGIELDSQPGQAKRLASYCMYWLGINYHVGSVSFSEEDSTVRIAIIIEAKTEEEASLIGKTQLNLLMQDCGHEEINLPETKYRVADWMNPMLESFRPGASLPEDYKPRDPHEHLKDAYEGN